MKRLLVLLVLLLVTGCNGSGGLPPRAIVSERPIINVPATARQSNWIGPYRQGSCVHAVMITLFRWQNHETTANYWRRTYSDGETPGGLAAKCDRLKLHFAYVIDGDAGFLEWACKTRRGAGVVVRGGAHMVTLVHFDETWAALLDNNNIAKFVWVPRETFVAEWKASGGWAVTPVYAPAAPLPQ